MEFILIIYIVYLIISRIIKPDLNYLNCGIFAWIGKYPSGFDITKFNLIGNENNDRGGDASGIFYDNVVIHGVRKFSEYPDFAENLDPFILRNNVVMGHARKASVGSTDVEYAQPVFITSKDEKYIDFVLIHNGTIHNYEELAKEFKLEDYDKDNDSKVLARIIHEKGFKVLEKYRGTASIIFWDRKHKNSLFVFRGESPFNANGIHLTEERPLYMFTESNENNRYFSSVKDPFKLLGKGKVEKVPENVVIEIKKNHIHSTTKINRQKASQSKYVPTTTTNSNWDFATRGSESVWNRNREKRRSLRVCENINNSSYLDNLESKDKNEYFIKLNSGGKVHINNEPTYGDVDRRKNKIYFNRGRYWLNGAIVNGIKHVNSVGYTFENPTTQTITLRFIEGIYIPEHVDFDTIMKYQNSENTNLRDSHTFNKIIKATPFPAHISIIDDSEENKMFYYDNKENTIYLFSGIYRPFFSDRSYTFRNGDLTGVYFEDDNISIDPSMEIKDFIRTEELVEFFEKHKTIKPDMEDTNDNTQDELVTGMEKDKLEGIINSIDSFIDKKIEELDDLELKETNSVIDTLSNFKIALNELTITI